MDVIIVEDIVDTGLTLNYLRNLLENRGPRSLKIAALLDRPSRRIQPVTVEYTGFTIPDAFVIGYGLDYAERYRNLRDVCVLDPYGDWWEVACRRHSSAFAAECPTVPAAVEKPPPLFLTLDGLGGPARRSLLRRAQTHARA
jgi:hypothetical protein